MSKIDYVIREDGMPLMITAESDFDFIDTEEILHDYPYIIESINKEDYYLENTICYAFDELVYENKVVGFATFDLQGLVLMLTECYIMPEFRDKQLFYDEICKMLYSAPQFGILQPTRDLVELLIDYSFAKKVTDDVVVSGIDFYFDDYDAKSNRRDEFSDEIPLSNFYDLGICSTVLDYRDEIIYHTLLENDLKRYGERKELTEDYFKSISELFYENDDFENLIQELKDDLPQEKLGYDEIIGSGEGLSEFMQGIVDNEMVSYDRAVEIKQQLIEEYESGEINDENIDERFVMLLLDNSDSMLLEGFKEFLDSSEDDEDMHDLKEFLDMIGDDEELSLGILRAVLSDDEMEFENLLVNAINEDDELFNNFIDLADKWDENEPTDDDYLDLSSLGLNLDSPYPIAEMMWGSDDEKYKLDDTFYGKDYPKSYDIYIFRVLKSLKKHNNLTFALATADMDGEMTSHTVNSLLHMQDLINDEVNYDNWDEFAHDSLTVNDLKNILRDNNLKISGKKQELIDRIAENQIPLDEFKSEKVIVTPNGEEFIQNNEWIDFYDTFLDKFNFNDFVKFLDTNDGEFIELVLKYLEKHLEIATKENDSTYIAHCIFVHNIISETGKEFFNIQN